MLKLAKQLKISGRRLEDESGTTMVEFAIVAVLLLTVVTLIAQGGFFFSAWLAVTNGAREGARYGVTCLNRQTNAQHPSWYDCSDADVRQLVIDRTTGFFDPDRFGVVVTHTVSGFNNNGWVFGEVFVTVTATVSSVGPLFGDLPVSARAVMRSEY